SIADRELSRNHSTVECDYSHHRRHSAAGSSSRDGGRGGGEDGNGTGNRHGKALCSTGGRSDGGGGGEGGGGGGTAEYFLCDVGSTNGTYVQLVGPYANSRRLELSDHILIGRTGFSINRFDWGVWEDKGTRKTMEDKSVIIQDMGVEPLAALGLGPQTFLAVYDGHGGYETSAFLWQRLHVAIAEVLEESTPLIARALQEDRAAERAEVFGSGGGGEAMRCADMDSGNESCRSLRGWTSPPVFSSSSGGSGMPPLPPPPSSSVAARSALSGTATGIGSSGSGSSGGGGGG
ncbi:unnamed protein product, partial [Laminaria digitata]